jgi:hypothetical protein
MRSKYEGGQLWRLNICKDQIKEKREKAKLED